MITHIPRRHIGVGIIGRRKEPFGKIGPYQVIVVPLTKRVEHLMEEAAHHCDYIEIESERFMINRMVEVEQYGHKIKKFKLEKVNTII